MLDETTKELDRLIKGIKSEERVSRKYMKYEDYWKGLKRQFKEEGRDEGELIVRIRQIQKKTAKGKELSQIAEEMEEEESALTPLYEAVISAGNDADPELIAEKLLENATED